MINTTFEEIPCNICGSKEFSVIYPANAAAEKDKDLVQKFRASGDELLIDQLVECKQCGLRYVNPRIKSTLIVKGYSEGSDEIFVSQASSRERTFFKSLEFIEKFAEKGKILDIGTAGGSFLAAAQKRGWEVYGCEPNKWLANWGKKHYNIPIQTGTIFDQKYKKDFFDVVTLWDVIEHTPDPSKVLNKCNQILKNGGILVVNYPDIGSWIAKAMGRKWLFLTSVHLYYFTQRTMRRMLEKNGFEAIVIKPHFQKLELGYLAFRAGNYSKFISKASSGLIHALRIEHKEIPYWLGQTFFIAKKVST